MIYTIRIDRNMSFFNIHTILKKFVDIKFPGIEGYNIATGDSDSDRDLLTPIMDTLNAELLTAMSPYLVTDEQNTEVYNQPSVADGFYVYKLDMPDNWKSNLLNSLAVKIDNYIVYGTIREYLERNIVVNNYNLPDKDDILSSIRMILFARKGGNSRPLQPF